MSGLVQRVTIRNQKGLHARAAARFVKVASTYQAEVEVEKGGQTVTGQSIMGLMMLAAAPGCEIEIRVNGDQQDDCMAALVDLVERKFDEE